MSDYFGALVRSSALTIGSGHPAGERRGAAQRSGNAPDAAISGDPFADDIEVQAERYVEAADAVSRPTLDGSRREALEAPEPRRHRSELLPRHEVDVSARNDAGDLEHLHRAALDAAMRWVTADRSPARADGETPLARATAAPKAPDARDASQQAAVHVVEHVTTRVVEPVFSPTAHEGVSMAQFEIGSHEIARQANADMQIRRDSPAQQPIEDIVDVSIGSIHVHVDSAPTRQPTAAQGYTGERRERARASGLERRYLRAI